MRASLLHQYFIEEVRSDTQTDVQKVPRRHYILELSANKYIRIRFAYGTV